MKNYQFAVGCCVYIRHRQVEQWRRERGQSLVTRRLILVTTWCGVLACFGLDILANFQEARVVAAHMIGALTCFTAGTTYFCLQVIKVQFQSNFLSLCQNEFQIAFFTLKKKKTIFIWIYNFILLRWAVIGTRAPPTNSKKCPNNLSRISCLQTYLSYKMAPAVNGWIIIYVRAVLSTLTLVLTIGTIVPGYISMLEFKGKQMPSRDYKKQFTLLKEFLSSYR